MTQQPPYYRYLETAKQADVADQLRGEGYSVESDVRFDDAVFDLVATRGSHKLAYEFKAGRSERTNREYLERLQQVARRHGLEFHIVVVSPPPRVHVEVDSLADQLHKKLAEATLPPELSTPSTHASIERVGSVNISDIRVGKGSIQVAGRGEVKVLLRTSGDSSDEPANEDWLWFDFRVLLTADARISAVEELVIDTSTLDE